MTSPPYFSARDYDAAGQIGLEKTPTEYIENLVDCLESVREALRDDGVMFLNIGDGMAEKNYPDIGVRKREVVGMPWLVAFALRRAGWRLVADYPWIKMNGKPSTVKDRFTPIHEYVFHFAKSDKHYHDKAAVQEPAKFAGQPRGGSSTRYKARHQGMDSKVYDTRNKRSAIFCNTVPNPEGHEAAFPPKLVEPLILAGCPEFVCSACGNAIDLSLAKKARTITNGRGLLLLPKDLQDIPVSSGTGQVLQQEVPCGLDEDGKTNHPVQVVRRTSNRGSAGPAASVLQPEMLEHLRGEKKADDDGKVCHDQGVHSNLSSVSSECSDIGLCDGASSCNGEASGSLAFPDGSGSPQERDQARQPTRKSRSNAKKSARPSAEDRKDRSHNLPVMRLQNTPQPHCPHCSAALDEPDALIGGLVIDPFAGSGTTGIVAKQLGRRFYGSELNPAYAALARERIAKTDSPTVKSG